MSIVISTLLSLGSYKVKIVPPTNKNIIAVDLRGNI